MLEHLVRAARVDEHVLFCAHQHVDILTCAVDRAEGAKEGAVGEREVHVVCEAAEEEGEAAAVVEAVAEAPQEEAAAPEAAAVAEETEAAPAEDGAAA